MQKAQDRGVRIWGTPWSPPASMKSNGNTNNGGSLLAGDYQAYANYLSSYVLGLKNSYGINLYAVSIQNEPDYRQAGSRASGRGNSSTIFWGTICCRRLRRTG